jgi:lysophospholipase L1-like esterase
MIGPVSALACAGLGVGLFLFNRTLNERAHRLPENSPEEFLSRKASGASPVSTRKVVVCAGDSITHGRVSSDYVGQLAKKLPKLEFVNAGLNADLSEHLLKRSDRIIECMSDYLVILIGTNDVRHSLHPRRGVHKRKGLSRAPSLEGYIENVSLLIEKVRARTQAKIILVSIPMLGEDPDSESNQLVKTFNATARELARGLNLSFVDLFVAQQEYLRAHPHEKEPPAYNPSPVLMYSVGIQHLMMGRSWKDLSRSSGLRLFTDNVHLNDIGAEMLADLVAKELV